MTPDEFIRKWRKVELKERTASHSHFIDLCHLLGVEDPVSADDKGDWYTFERGADWAETIDRAIPDAAMKTTDKRTI